MLEVISELIHVIEKWSNVAITDLYLIMINCLC